MSLEKEKCSPPTIMKSLELENEKLNKEVSDLKKITENFT